MPLLLRRLRPTTWNVAAADFVCVLLITDAELQDWVTMDSGLLHRSVGLLHHAVGSKAAAKFHKFRTYPKNYVNKLAFYYGRSNSPSAA
jgi:hypothetical protein